MGTGTYNKHLEVYKDIHKGMDGILLSTGPTIDKFKNFEGYDDLIKFGVNKIYRHKFINDLDYYFFGSFYYVEPDHKVNVDNLPKDLKKFSSVYRDGQETGLGNISRDDSDILGCVPFECGLEAFTDDISNDKILGHSIVFPVLQVMLYMGFKNIYIVGCDVTGQDSKSNIQWWHKFKTWKESTYEDVKITVINPITLRGLFNDYDL